jgi:DNA repair exonuclease SbcCD nuclease subunit
MNKKLYIIGDIHGEYKYFLHLIERYKMENCHIIIAGDIGLGFYKVNYYIDMFNMMNIKLKNKNIHLYLIRGNHDNPEWFSNPPEPLTLYSNIHIIKDYTVLNLCNHHILCIGGAVSVDKSDRYLGLTWWEGEEVFKIDNLNDIIKENNIDIVVSHTNPCFVEPKMTHEPFISVEDFRLIKESAKYLGEVFFYLIENNNPLKYWVHGHHHKHTETYLPNIFTEIDKKYMLAGLLIKMGTYKDGPIKVVGLNQIDNKLDRLDIL